MEALLRTIRALAYVADAPSLAALDDTRREPLADLDQVLPDLIDTLDNIVTHDPEWAERSSSEFLTIGYPPSGLRCGAQLRQLLAEAIQWHSGVDGLADQARTPGPLRAGWYEDWVDALVCAGRTDDAEQAAGEALRELDQHEELRAMLADRLAWLALARDDGAALLAARCTAWQASPTPRRLVRLVGAATALGLESRVEMLAAEAERAVTGSLALRHPALTASLLLLAGRVDDAVDLMARTDPRYWHDPEHPSQVVVPFLLVGGSGADRDPRWASLLLRDLLEHANSSYWRDTLNGDFEGFRAALAAGSAHSGRIDRAMAMTCACPQCSSRLSPLSGPAPSTGAGGSTRPAPSSTPGLTSGSVRWSSPSTLPRTSW